MGVFFRVAVLSGVPQLRDQCFVRTIAVPDICK